MFFANRLRRSLRADRTRCKLPDALWLVWRRDWPLDAVATATHRRTTHRESRRQVRHRGRIAARLISAHNRRHRENNAPAADRFLIADRSGHRRGKQGNESKIGTTHV